MKKHNFGKREKYNYPQRGRGRMTGNRGRGFSNYGTNRSRNRSERPNRNIPNYEYTSHNTYNNKRIITPKIKDFIPKNFEGNISTCQCNNLLFSSSSIYVNSVSLFFPFQKSRKYRREKYADIMTLNCRTLNNQLSKLKLREKLKLGGMEFVEKKVFNVSSPVKIPKGDYFKIELEKMKKNEKITLISDDEYDDEYDEQFFQDGDNEKKKDSSKINKEKVEDKETEVKNEKEDLKVQSGDSPLLKVKNSENGKTIDGKTIKVVQVFDSDEKEKVKNKKDEENENNGADEKEDGKLLEKKEEIKKEKTKSTSKVIKKEDDGMMKYSIEFIFGFKDKIMETEGKLSFIPPNKTQVKVKKYKKRKKKRNNQKRFKPNKK